MKNNLKNMKPSQRTKEEEREIRKIKNLVRITQGKKREEF
jgi:hypothetical protein